MNIRWMIQENLILETYDWLLFVYVIVLQN